MIELAPRYIVDQDGNRTAVILDIETYEHLLEEIEDAADVRAYDEAKAALAAGEDEVIPLDQVVAEYEARHGVRLDQPS